jgi:hypothetical protein
MLQAQHKNAMPAFDLKMTGWVASWVFPKWELGRRFPHYWNLPFQEAWHMLRGETPGFVDRIEACAEEDFPQGSPPLKCPTQAKGRLEWAKRLA